MPRPTHLQSARRFDLTDRQEEVLNLIAAGKTNAEIADDLGISLDGAKYHVREILGKLGFESREQAAEWWRHEQRPAARIRRSWRDLASVMTARWLLTAGLAAGVVAVAAVSAIVLLGGPDGKQAPPAQSPTPVASPAATPSSVVAVRPCTDDDVIPSLRAVERPTQTYLAVYVDFLRPCRLSLDTPIRLERANGGGIAPADGNPASVSINYTAPSATSVQVAEATVSNWCAESTALGASVTLLSKTTQSGSFAAPPCTGAAKPALFEARALDPDAPSPSLPVCNAGAGILLFPKMTYYQGGAFLQIDVDAQLWGDPTPPPCHLADPISLTVLSASREPVTTILSNGASASVSADLPALDPVARFSWYNWCGDPGPFYLRFTLVGHATDVLLDAPPGCFDATGITKLEVMGPPLPPVRPSPTPLAGGLKPVTELRGDPSVWLYADVTPASDICIEIVGDMVPAAAAGSVAAKPFTCTGDLSRLHFASDGGDTYYLLGVQLLLLAKITLPQPNSGGDGSCNSIREHLIPASESADSAAYVLVCDAQPLPRGAVSPDPVTIWARIVADLAPATVPLDAPCWSLSRYLGAPGEAVTIEVQCRLE